jgi:hypothetical protein
MSKAIVFMSELLQAHQLEFQLVRLLMQAVEHPLVSFLVFIAILVVLSKIVKIIDRLIEIAGLSILKVPVKIMRVIVGGVFQLFSKIFDFLLQRFLPDRTDKNQPFPIILEPPIIESVEQQKYQRILEITNRLEAIRQEQNELLQEVATLLAPESQIQEPVRSGNQ